MFRSEMQVNLLALTMLQPGREWTLDHLSAQLNAPQSSVHRELGRLAQAGLVTRDSKRRPYSYQAATEAPAYGPLRELLELTAGVSGRLGRELAQVPGVLAASVHGSWAAGRVRPDSDLDILVVTEGDRQSALRAARRVGREVDREVDSSVLSLVDYLEMLNAQNPFLAKILDGPRIDVIGTLADLSHNA
jgi:predicted nucleotidyltransferase